MRKCTVLSRIRWMSIQFVPLGGNSNEVAALLQSKKNAPLNMDDDEDDDEEEGGVEMLDDDDDGSLITLSLYFLLCKIK
jgi:hypothetical protein